VDYQHVRHCVHLIVYHLIFCPKRRRVLVGPVQKRLEQIIDEVITERGWQLIEQAIQPDHVHLFVRTNPSTLPSDVPQADQRTVLTPLAPGICPCAETAHPVDSFVLFEYGGQCQQRDDPAIYRATKRELGNQPPITPNKERPFISALERTELSGPFSVKLILLPGRTQGFRLLHSGGGIF
jgi:hypothetical protein